MNFSELYGRYAEDVHRFALYLCGNQSLAEDLTSETFVRALCGPTDLRLGTVKAYLFAITRNLYRDSVGKLARTVVTGSVPERHDPRPSPEVSAQGRQELQNTLRLIQKLPEQQREALLLASDGDVSYEEIGRILGCSIAAVKVRIHRARMALKAELKERTSLCKT
jgi:RNA polymerase sigma-70 factor (ECF subfamily)